VHGIIIPKYKGAGYTAYTLPEPSYCTRQVFSGFPKSAISVQMALDKETDVNGAGQLIIDYYVRECSWYSFTDNERWIMERAIRRFRRELERAGFLPIPEHGGGEPG